MDANLQKSFDAVEALQEQLAILEISIKDLTWRLTDSKEPESITQELQSQLSSLLKTNQRVLQDLAATREGINLMLEESSEAKISSVEGMEFSDEVPPEQMAFIQQVRSEHSRASKLGISEHKILEELEEKVYSSEARNLTRDELFGSYPLEALSSIYRQMICTASYQILLKEPLVHYLREQGAEVEPTEIDTREWCVLRLPALEWWYRKETNSRLIRALKKEINAWKNIPRV